MTKNMCNMCGMGKYGIVLRHRILGNVCRSCYNKYILGVGIYTKELLDEANLRRGVLEGDIGGVELGDIVYKAIEDSLKRYQMLLVGIEVKGSEVVFRYKGVYKRSDVMVEIRSNNNEAIVDVIAINGGVVYIRRIYSLKGNGEISIERIKVDTSRE